VVTAEAPALDSPLSEELDSLEVSPPPEAELVVDSVAVEDSPLVEVSPPVDSVLEVDEDVPAVLAAARRSLLATSAGSCPEASCTYTIRNATANNASASPATERRMRRVRRRIASRCRLAVTRGSGCAAVRGESVTGRRRPL
jgi:hypothetical protein